MSGDSGKGPSPPTWSWVPRLMAAGVMAWVSFLKLSGNPNDIALFTQLGLEPTGRVMIGIIEGVCAVLLLSRLVAVGGVLTCGVMIGAMGAHLTKLGLVVQGDGGAHVGLLLVVLASSSTVAWLHRRALPIVGEMFSSDS